MYVHYVVCIYKGVQVAHFNFSGSISSAVRVNKVSFASIRITTNRVSILAQDTSSCGSSDYGSKYVKVVTLQRAS